MYRILELNPQLQYYSRDIDLRMERYFQTKYRLLSKGQTLNEFANAHNYYGFHHVDGGWVYREWAPSAYQLYLEGEFNNWNKTSHPLKKLENGNYVEVTNAKPVTFALGCEIQGDVKARRVWFYLCNVAPINEATKSKADSIEANAITLNITVRPIEVNAEYSVTHISAKVGDANYSSFLTTAPTTPEL